MGNGLCVEPCTPAQRMAYSQSTASPRNSEPAEQKQQAVVAANSNVTAASKTAAVSIPARSNSVLDVQA